MTTLQLVRDMMKEEGIEAAIQILLAVRLHIRHASLDVNEVQHPKDVDRILDASLAISRAVGMLCDLDEPV